MSSSSIYHGIPLLTAPRRNNLYYNADRVPSPHNFGGYSNMKRGLKASDDQSFFTTEFDRSVVGGPGDGSYGGPNEGDMHPGVGVGVGDPSRGMSSYHNPLQHVQDPSQIQLSHHPQHSLPHHAQHAHPHSLSHPQHAPHAPQPPPQQGPPHHQQQPQSQHPQHSQHAPQPPSQQQQQQQQPQQSQQQQQMSQPLSTQPSVAPTPNPKKRQRGSAKGSQGDAQIVPGAAAAAGAPSGSAASPAKRSRTNTAWTQAEEQLLKTMRDAGSSWSDIAKSFPSRTEGSVKKHWYKDMHWAEFGEEEVFPPHATRNVKFRQKKFRTKEADINASSSQSALLLAAIKEYDANKWKAIGMKLNKPAKACEAYAKEHFANKL